MAEFDTDYLIIGQGLAGTALAWHLVHAGQRVLVLDDGHRTAASRVAAGMINPLAGMRFRRPPELDDWLRSADAWYTALEPVCGGPVRYEVPMVRLFRSMEQQRFHRRRSRDPLSRGLLGPDFPPAQSPEPVDAPFGGFLQRRTGYVALPRVLDGIASWLRGQGILIRQDTPPGALQTGAQGVTLGPYHARVAIFCDGARLSDNRWFSGLPLAPDKGEILTLRARGWFPRHIVNGAHWLLPQANGTLRFGATHSHRDHSQAVTPGARDALLGGLRRLAPQQRFDVVDQQAGIRPGTRDRYPLIGRHPTVSTVCVCNGFGARGALTAPWYTQRLAAHLVDGLPLPPEADVRRFG